jgi:hypothetical protein
MAKKSDSINSSDRKSLAEIAEKLELIPNSLSNKECLLLIRDILMEKLGLEDSDKGNLADALMLVFNMNGFNASAIRQILAEIVWGKEAVKIDKTSSMADELMR